MKRFFIRNWFNKIEMKTTHCCAEKSDGEDDLITERKSYFVEEVTTEQGGAHEGDGEGDVADARDVGAIFVGDSFGEEGVETDAEGGEGNRHEEGDGDDGVDLGGCAEEPGEEDETEEADAIVDGGPKHSAVYFLFFEPASGGDGEEECDDSRHGANEPDLVTSGAETGGVDIEEVDGGTADDPIPANIEIEMQKVGAIFFGDGVLTEEFVEHYL